MVFLQYSYYKPRGSFSCFARFTFFVSSLEITLPHIVIQEQMANRFSSCWKEFWKYSNAPEKPEESKPRPAFTKCFLQAAVKLKQFSTDEPDLSDTRDNH